MESSQPVRMQADELRRAMRRLGYMGELEFLITPDSRDVFEVPGGDVLSWDKIEVTRPTTPPKFWLDVKGNRGQIPNSYEWLQAKGFIESGIPTGWRIRVRQDGHTIARMRMDAAQALARIHFSGIDE